MLKKSLALILAASLLIVSFTAAFASGAGLFSELIETDCFDERLERLDEIAETVSLSQSEGGVTVEVSQAYYEGNRVFISYRADGPILEPQLDAAGADRLEELRRGFGAEQERRVGRPLFDDLQKGVLARGRQHGAGRRLGHRLEGVHRSGRRARESPDVRPGVQNPRKRRKARAEAHPDAA